MVWFRLVVDFTEKNIFNSLIAFSFWKAFTFTSFERFLCWRSKLLPALFSRNFLKSWIVNYWGSIFTLYLAWGAFSLVCVLSVYFFLLSFFYFFPFLSVLSVTDTKDSQNSRQLRRNYYFSYFSLPPAHKYSFSSSRFFTTLF